MAEASDTPKPADPMLTLHSDALTDAIAQMIEQHPEQFVGLYAVRYGRNRPEVAAAIRIMADGATAPQIACFINGREVSIEKMAARLRGNRHHRRIDEATYRWLLDDREWARRHAPGDPAANPYRPVDLRQIPPVLPPKRPQ